MATLVLSTVGTALGGPVGSAIGALIGQSIDQQLLAPPRRGPRVGDLSVQTSSYGTQIPRIYGTMRVAGSVIWATELVEHEATDGAKGQPDVSYSYTVSMAVAVSSRRAVSVKRIWADGKLLRGAAGDFKVGTKFRFYTGDQDQEADPFIASVEGLSATPAYRGLALCVFEDLELGEFGNRIPFLSFEITADDDPASIGTIISDASRGAIVADAEQDLVGYAAYGRSMRDAVQPVVEQFGIDLRDDGEVLRSPSQTGSIFIGGDEFGAGVEVEPAKRLHREQAPARSLPAALRVTFHDPARDYQTGEARATIGDGPGVEQQVEVPGVLAANAAKGLAQQILSRAWSTRDRLTVRLPPARITVAPGDIVILPLAPARWKVVSSTIEAFACVMQLTPAESSHTTQLADPGRSNAIFDEPAGPIQIALLDVPDIGGTSAGTPTIMLAASSSGGAWKRQTAAIEFGGQRFIVQTARTRSVLGTSATGLGPGPAALIDTINRFDVELVDHGQWLTSCDDDGLAAGLNLAVLGDEILQFGNAEPLAPGRFRLSRLLRGRGGTEWACGGHVSGETFCLLRDMQSILLPITSMGSVVSASIGTIETTLLSAGASLRPLAPVNLTATRQSDGSFALTWTRRSRQGYPWSDGVDAPLGEAIERYRVLVAGNLGVIEVTSEASGTLLTGEQIGLIGSGPAKISVHQIGDFAISRPAELTVTLS